MPRPPSLLTAALLVVFLFSTTNTASSSSLSASGPHIADVNILLPPKMTHPVEYRLQGSDGCFKWSWDHHDILSVLPEYNSTNHCSTSARLKSIAPFSGRKETAVYATDVNTGMVIRCKVYIDIFSRMQIFHNSVKLDLDGLTTLRVRAFDSEDNVFSSLVGIQFMWQMKPESAESHHHLVHVPLKDSPLSDCSGLCGDLDVQVKLEESNVFSDLFVVKGTEIGHEIVSVHLIEPLFEHMEDKIVITVAEAMFLEPSSPVYVLIGAVIQYTLKIIRENRPQIVNLPSKSHKWSVFNSSVAEIDKSNGKTYALNLGVTVITVEDTRVASHIQVSSLHVVLPDSLLLYISPIDEQIERSGLNLINRVPSASRWYVISGRQYFINFKVFSQGGKEIYITEQDDIKLHDDQSEFCKILDNKESSKKILQAYSYGLGKLTGVLTYKNGYREGKEVLKVVQEIMVCDQVRFIMEHVSGTHGIIYLPWGPGIQQELELSVIGGCAIISSDYKWFSSDMSIVSVSASGIIQVKKPGKVIIKAVSIFDSINFDELEIEVSVPSSMVILPDFPVEFSVGSFIEASVTLKGPDGNYYYRCDAFSTSVKWKTETDLFEIVNASIENLNLGPGLGLGLSNGLFYGPSCAKTYIHALSPARSVLHATLNKEYESSSNGFNVLKASSDISAYLPLILHQVSNGNKYGGYFFDETNNQLENLNELYLVPGTSLDVKLYGGPTKWDHNIEHIETFEILNEAKSGVHVHELSSSYRIECKKFGTFNILFKRGNLIGENHLLPAVSEVLLSLECINPSSISIIADEDLNTLEVIKSVTQAERIKNVRSTPVTVSNGRKIRISAIGINKNGKPFGNSSSLNLKWDLINCDKLASWDEEYEPKKAGPTSWEKFLALRNATGTCTVRASVFSSENTLTDAINLNLVSSLIVTPSFGLLFFNPEAKMNLSVKGGSCFLHTIVNDTQVLKFLPSPIELKCSQLILSPKNIGSGLITVNDIGLNPPISAFSVIQVVDIDWINITSSSELSLVQGTSHLINILSGIEDGKIFDSSQYIYMNIRVHIEDPIIQVLDNNNGYLKGSSFEILANRIGITSLYVSAKRYSGHEITSHVIKVEVYAPPILYPEEIFIVPGGSYVVSVKGGPTFGESVKYVSGNESVVKIHESLGKIEAVLVGNTSIIANIYGNNGILICQAFGKVKVEIPDLALLNLQSEKLAIGNKMSIYPILGEGNLFSFYEMCDNYEWFIEDEEVLTFRKVNDLAFYRIVYGKSSGETKVEVSFLCDFGVKTQFYNASVFIYVVPDLPLSLGSVITWVLPPYYTSSNLLPSSSNPHTKGDAPTRKGTITYSILGGCNKMENEAIIIEGSKIKTKESNNLACIQAKDKSTKRVEIASCVKVADVAQIGIKPISTIHTLAVGSKLELQVKYYDILGNVFHEGNNLNLYEAQTNYPNVVSIEYDSEGEKIYLKGLSYGKALVRIGFFNNFRKSDYAMVLVGPHLYPQNSVFQTGSKFNFSIQGLNEEITGNWLSKNEAILTLDSKNGKAEAIKEGESEIIFESLNFKLFTKVTVVKGRILTVNAPDETFLTNVPFPVKGYNFSLNFDEVDFLFDCKVDPVYIGFAKPWRDLDTSKSYCLFFPFSPEHLASSAPKLRDDSVSVTALLRNDGQVFGQASARFIGGFSVVEDLSRLKFTLFMNKSVVNIVGNTDLDINWSDKERLEVKKIYGDNFGIGGRIGYEVKVCKAEQFNDKIIIRVPRINQRVEIDVSFEIPEEKILYSTSSLWVIFFTVLVILSSVIVFICYLDRPERNRGGIVSENVAGGAGGAGPTGPATPVRGSPGVVEDNYSPRTPQPFIDYIRQTIDDTPYYRQDYRRRVNPQRTF